MEEILETLADLNIGVEFVNEIHLLGTDNLNHILKEYEFTPDNSLKGQKRTKKEIEKEIINEFELPLTKKEFVEKSKKYDDPNIPESGWKISQYTGRSRTIIKEPTRIVDLERKETSTTFNNCGWCEHAFGNSSYKSSTNFVLNAECQFYSQREYGHLDFSDPCFFKSLDDKQYEKHLKKLIKEELKEAWEAEKSEREFENEINPEVDKYLLEAIDKAKNDVPLLTKFRNGDYINENVDLKVLVDDLETPPKFMDAKYVSTHNWVDGPTSSQFFVEGAGAYECNNRGPYVFRADEIKFLKNNPAHAKVYAMTLYINRWHDEREKYVNNFLEAITNS